MCYHVVGNVSCYNVSVDGDGSLAHRAASVIGMRIVERVSRKVPEHYILAPVACDADDQAVYGTGDVDLLRARALCGHLLCEIDVLVRTRLVYI